MSALKKFSWSIFTKYHGHDNKHEKINNSTCRLRCNYEKLQVTAILAILAKLKLVKLKKLVT